MALLNKFDWFFLIFYHIMKKYINQSFLNGRITTLKASWVFFKYWKLFHPLSNYPYNLAILPHQSIVLLSISYLFICLYFSAASSAFLTILGLAYLIFLFRRFFCRFSMIEDLAFSHKLVQVQRSGPILSHIFF